MKMSREMGHLRLVLIAAISAIAAIACVRPPTPTGYLENYDRLAAQPAPYLGLYAERTDAGKEPRIDHIVQLLPSRWDAERLDDPQTEARLLELLDLRLFVYLLRYAPPSVIVTRNRDVDDFIRAGVNVTQLRVSITDIKRGIGIVRLLLGFHLGATQLQVEGQLVDFRTRRVLLRFARRSLSDGAVYFLPTPWSLSPAFCWKLSIDQTAQMIA